MYVKSRSRKINLFPERFNNPFWSIVMFVNQYVYVRTVLREREENRERKGGIELSRRREKETGRCLYYEKEKHAS